MHLQVIIISNLNSVKTLLFKMLAAEEALQVDPTILEVLQVDQAQDRIVLVHIQVVQVLVHMVQVLLIQADMIVQLVQAVIIVAVPIMEVAVIIAGVPEQDQTRIMGVLERADIMEEHTHLAVRIMEAGGVPLDLEVILGIHHPPQQTQMVLQRIRVPGLEVVQPQPV